MVVRVAVGDPKAITADFPDVADGSVEVTVESARGDALAGPFIATDVGSGSYSHQLTAANVAAVDDLKLTFTGEVDSIEFQRIEYVEVAGAYYFTVQEARSIGSIGSEFSDHDIERQRMAVEDQIEANVYTSFVARYVDERLSGMDDHPLKLIEPFVLRLIEVVEGSTDITSAVTLDGRYVQRNAIWTPAVARNVRTKYESGYSDTPPADVRRAAIEATRHELIRSRHQGTPSAVIQMGTEVGVLKMAIAGLRMPFGVPEVDSVIARWHERLDLPL